ncbi:SH3 domain-containing protein [Deltaproteobacteria bacterium TL4]
MKQTKIALLLISSLMVWSSIAFAETMYVRSFHAFVMEAPQLNSKKLIPLERGESVEIQSTQGLWMEISAKGQKGWISKMVLSKTPIAEKISLLATEVDISSKARVRASTFSSTAAARGLMSSGRERISSRQTTNFEALEALETQSIDEAEAVRFITDYTES